MAEILLDSNTLQKDLRIRLPKQVLSNLPVKIGDTFDIYLNLETQEIILRPSTATAGTHAGNENEASK